MTQIGCEGAYGLASVVSSAPASVALTSTRSVEFDAGDGIVEAVISGATVVGPFTFSCTMIAKMWTQCNCRTPRKIRF